MAQNWALEAHIGHISEVVPMSYEAKLMWIKRKLLNEIVENLNFDSIGARNIWACGAYLLHIYKSSSDELINQVFYESSGNFSRK